MSILITFSKIYEKAVSIQLTDYLSCIFSSLFWALRKNYSCQSTLLNMIENFKYALDNGEYIACISMDVAKPLIVYLIVWLFVNCVLMAFPGMRVRWLPVTFNDENSEWRSTILEEAGIGNKLIRVYHKIQFWDPCFSIFFMNDLFYFVKHANLFNYADDNSVSVNGKKLNTVYKPTVAIRSRGHRPLVLLQCIGGKSE